jgi:hypothetical protein
MIGLKLLASLGSVYFVAALLKGWVIPAWVAERAAAAIKKKGLTAGCFGKAFLNARPIVYNGWFILIAKRIKPAKSGL